MKHLFSALLLLALVACGSDKNSIEIRGQFYGQPKKTIFLEELSPSGSTIIDSAKTDDKGKFKILITQAHPVPTFYNIHLADSYVPILAQAGEKIDISAVGNIFFNYTVEGSAGSSLVKEFNTLMRNSSLELDSLFTLYETAVDTETTQDLGRQYFSKYVDLKRKAITFVVTNSNSLAALLPLYHPRNDGQYLFDEPEDYIYFKMVSDSLSAKYPQSPYSRALRSDLEKVLGAQQLDSLIQAKTTIASDFPEISMTDAAGQKQNLSQYRGKTILLDFTASSPAQLKVINRELINVYDKYKDRGLIVFQVSLDDNKATWLKTVSDARLPWISVCDFMGDKSPAVRTYNVKKIPSNFLIAPSGEIIATNLYGAELEEALNKTL